MSQRMCTCGIVNGPCSCTPLTGAPGQRQWLPGQALHSAQEVMQALLDGEKVHAHSWDTDAYLQLVGGRLCNQAGVLDGFDDYETQYRIYTPPKRRMRRVTSERWFAIVDVDRWSTAFRSELEARYDWPNALAYHCATVEIDVPEAHRPNDNSGG